ncbi:hypothetical protein E0H59_13515 [Rhizobium leguminosarum bv. viciae]|nr:hypothetical protein E0H59_13515 [Rhizobium leguminosarum bv. viciae]
MTSEVCMMNRLAVVLAADSATTITQWTDQGKQERYFKGANKVFQLSNSHPVGVMIFDSADILRVPWEIVIKSFRTQLSSKSFNTVDEYAQEFFNFITGNTSLFPESVQTEITIAAARSAALTVVNEAFDKGETEDTNKAAIAEAVKTRLGVLQALELDDCLAKDGPDRIQKALGETLKNTLTEWSAELGWPVVDIVDDLVLLGIEEVFKNPGDHFGTTGLVFAGFGDHDIFPTMVEYLSSGVIDNHSVHKRQNTTSIDHDTPAWLTAFAQTSMSDTFSLGFSRDIYSSLMVAVDGTLKAYTDEIVADSGGDAARLGNVSARIDVARQKISDEVMSRARNEHALPLRRVLGVLPVDEMAELAETLITLQSLKEKVTKPSETVGGPIDVAVITKHEGLVWIKRKHFFDSELNSRYKLRQAAQLR